MLFILAAALVILFTSFLCSLCESVLLSMTPAFIAVEVEKPTAMGRLLKNVSDNSDRSLSAILALNTIVNTLGAAAIAYLVHMEFGDKWVSLFAVGLTLLILFGAEILPKTLGRNHFKSMAGFCSVCIQIMIVLLYPIVRATEVFSKILSSPAEEPDVTRDEMIKNAEIGVEEGTLKAKESNIIKNLMKLDKIYISDIMTPRSVIMALEADMTVDEVAKKFRPIRFSRIPVFDETLDHIIGVTHRYKILEALSQDQHHTKIRDLITSVVTLSERMTVSVALDFFVKEKAHLAMVTDEYGVVTGLVTLEDAVETLLGVEIVDEFDNIEDMRKYALEQWQQRKRSSQRL
jgi:CBS domain containing-hemolysin-like protein